MSGRSAEMTEVRSLEETKKWGRENNLRDPLACIIIKLKLIPKLCVINAGIESERGSMCHTKNVQIMFG